MRRVSTQSIAHTMKQICSSCILGFLYELGPPSSGVYSFVSYPSTVLPNRPKYRNEGGSSPVNIMHDRRVVRGNTYAANSANRIRNSFIVNPTDDEIIRQRQNERRTYVKKRSVLPNIKGGLNVPPQTTTTNSAGSSTGKSSDDAR